MANIICRILDVTISKYRKDGEERERASLVLKSGDDVIQASLFDQDVKNGRAKVFEKLVGRDAVCDLSPEQYRGQLQWRVGFNDPRPVGPAAKNEAA